MRKDKSLTPDVLQVLRDQATEKPFSGTYNDFDEKGSYLCKGCGLVLFRSNSKFHSGCGWPSFDEEIQGAVATRPDVDGRRTEIVCTRCEAHLGHVFHGEGHTAKDTRHCVNSLALDFVASQSVLDTEEAIFAAGCFWGVEHLFKQLDGVVKTEVGYSGGSVDTPSYESVCGGGTGHYEVIRVLYDPSIVNFEKVAKYFFEIHDPSQADGQGPDIGQQYHSVVFYYDDKQKEMTENLIALLQDKGISVATKVLPVTTFWRGEEYHQDYYKKHSKAPYCHMYTKRF